jgi:acid stress-induced BolA-like protein IbaG/YrbA
MIDPEELKRRVLGAVPGADIELKDMTGTGDHFEARIVSESFTGKTMVEQHQVVYGALSDWLKTGELHALSLRTFTPEHWAYYQSKMTRKT